MTPTGAPPIERVPSPRILIEQAMADAGLPLADFVAIRRQGGKSWRLIAIELSTRTGVDITSESLRKWFG